MNEKMLNDYLTLMLDQQIAYLQKEYDDYRQRANSGGYSDYYQGLYAGMWQGISLGVASLKDIKSRMGL